MNKVQKRENKEGITLMPNHFNYESEAETTLHISPKRGKPFTIPEVEKVAKEELKEAKRLAKMIRIAKKKFGGELDSTVSGEDVDNTIT